MALIYYTFCTCQGKKANVCAAGSVRMKVLIAVRTCVVSFANHAVCYSVLWQCCGVVPLFSKVPLYHCL